MKKEYSEAGRQLLEKMRINKDERIEQFVSLLGMYNLLDKPVYNAEEICRYNSLLIATVLDEALIDELSIRRR